MGKVILDNTDQFEPNMPNFSSFINLNEEDWNTAEDSSQEGKKKKKKRNGDD